MTDLELACLWVIRIEGPIHGLAVARRLEADKREVGRAIMDLYDRGLIDTPAGEIMVWDVTPRGRVKFSAMHRPSKKDITARLKARAGWKGAKG